MDRDTDLQALRPNIPLLIDETGSPQEKFQNRCLRPVLKLQNELLLAVFRGYVKKRKNVYVGLSKEERLKYIDHSVHKDQRLKELLCGLMIGHFTLEEWTQFMEHESELRRRLIALLIQRLQSQSEKLAEL